jgi:hypothetical protein
VFADCRVVEGGQVEPVKKEPVVVVVVVVIGVVVEVVEARKSQKISSQNGLVKVCPMLISILWNP